MNSHGPKAPPDKPSPPRGARAGLVVLGVALALVLLEIGLRAGGALWTQSRERGNVARLDDSDAIRILCLGESTTAYGYPEVLERLLNQDAPLRPYRVFNEGVAGTTTDQILARVPGLLARYDPDVVVAMIGVNDPKETPSGEGASDGRPVLARLRVVELYTLLVQHLRDRFSGIGAGPAGTPGPPPETRARIERAEAARVAGRIDQARSIAEEATRADPRSYDAWRIRLITELTAETGPRRDAVRPAEAYFLQQLQQDPGDLDARLTLARLYLDVAAYEDLRSLLIAAPERARAHRPWQRLLASAYEFPAADAARKGAWDLAIRYLEDGLAVLPPAAILIRAEFRDRLARAEQSRGDAHASARHTARARALRARLDDSFTAKRYRALHAAVVEHGSRLVAVPYPGRPVGALREILDDAEDVVFVDHAETFQRAVDEHGFWGVYVDEFAGDFGHMSELGKTLLSRNVAASVRRAVARASCDEPAVDPDSIAPNACSG